MSITLFFNKNKDEFKSSTVLAYSLLFLLSFLLFDVAVYLLDINKWHKLNDFSHFLLVNYSDVSFFHTPCFKK